MWSSVIPQDVESASPSARSKHSATLVGNYVYVLGGRNGNLPMKDFWRYNLVTGKWQQLKPSGDKLPCLQEHSAVVYKDCIYVFGGEVSFSAGGETPLWVYDIKNNSWKKIQSKNGTATPKGRRGHTALVHKGKMFIYGGYQDLRGSCSELWTFNFETYSWHLLSSSSPKKYNTDTCPPGRHKHSAVLHNDSIWIYGGMTDLQERADFWKWDTTMNSWTCIKTKISPGPLHSHAACRLPSSMIIFGGERDGHPTNDLWKYSFCTETWEKIIISGVKPQPRAETVAFAVSEFLLENKKSIPTDHQSLVRHRPRTCNSVDRNNRHSSYIPNNKVDTIEKTYTFKATESNYVDGSQNGAMDKSSRYSKNSFLDEITKLSQLNIPKLNTKCNYTVLGCNKTESTESLLRQFASPTVGFDNDVDDSEITTPTRGTMVKSKSAFVIKRKDISPISPEDEKIVQRIPKHVEFASGSNKIPREPISVPNFTLLTLPTPSLTPVEAARLVFLDTDDDESDNEFVPPKFQEPPQPDPNIPKDNALQTLQPDKREGSYNSHLSYADNPLYQHIIEGKKFQSFNDGNENVSATSDYSSIETVNRLSSASCYSVKVQAHIESSKFNKKDDRFGFCNPNYMGPDIKTITNNEKIQICKMLNTPDSLLEESKQGEATKSNAHKEELEFQELDGKINKVVYRNASCKSPLPPKSLPLEKTYSQTKDNTKHRANSASRVEKQINKIETVKRVNANVRVRPIKDDFIPLYVFIVGGKEQGQVTVFKRPLSIWKLKLY
ncbi:uncharacterized protein LOC108744347 [Agrilus planipennis]|uniref:Uncharacterized protein LOC108744347 n=1 Tax=Agrilus planipennis TaxID=224129 RepID=A0A1W4XT01_AGRPL|nr:uncharacterized protein LOC108744347 [Agrilus planipennis]XP_018335555.1 uncharacterized protein LOC108744347 [Agrilus planipennis]XP_025832109.1 uncharacterized protein LOC108744347 [Agrilus planipennis]